MSLRSIPPTARDVQRSHDTLESPLSPLLLLSAAALSLRLLGPPLFVSLRSLFADSLGALSTDVLRVPSLSLRLMLPLAWALLVLSAGATLASLAQTRGALHRGSQPRRVPPEGVGVAGSVALIGVGLLLAFHLAMTAPGESVLSRARAAFDAGLALIFAVGLMDYALRYTRWREALSLTPDEARRRARDDDGDPVHRARRRSLHFESLSSVVDTSPDWHVFSDGRVLVVIAWREGDAPPRVVLRAEGALHHEILARATDRQLPRFYRPDLVRAFGSVLVGGDLPRSLWEAFAGALLPPRNS